MGFSVRSICQAVVFYSSLFDVQLAWCLVCPPSIQCVASPHYHRLTMEICMENISGTCSHLPPSMLSFFSSFHVIPFPLCSNIQKFARGKETSVNRSQTSKCKRDEVKSWLHSMWQTGLKYILAPYHLCIENSMDDSWHHQIFWKDFGIICLAKLKYTLIFFGGLVSIFMEGLIKNWC